VEPQPRPGWKLTFSKPLNRATQVCLDTALHGRVEEITHRFFLPILGKELRKLARHKLLCHLSGLGNGGTKDSESARINSKP
jgi:hypothetical protein